MTDTDTAEAPTEEAGTYVVLGSRDGMHRWELCRPGGEVLEHGAWHPGRAQPMKDGSTHGRRVATRVAGDSLFTQPEAPEVVDTLPL